MILSLVSFIRSASPVVLNFFSLKTKTVGTFKQQYNGRQFQRQRSTRRGQSLRKKSLLWLFIIFVSSLLWNPNLSQNALNQARQISRLKFPAIQSLNFKRSKNILWILFSVVYGLLMYGANFTFSDTNGTENIASFLTALLIIKATSSS